MTAAVCEAKPENPNNATAEARGLAGAASVAVAPVWPTGRPIGRQYRFAVLDLNRGGLVSVHRSETCGRLAAARNYDPAKRCTRLLACVPLDGPVRNLTDGRTVREHFGC